MHSANRVNISLKCTPNSAILHRNMYKVVYIIKKILKNDHFDNVLGGSSDLILHFRPCLLGFEINFVSLQ